MQLARLKIMYFSSREQAGRMLANRLVKQYRYENCSVIALNDGGAIVGMEIAKQLHSQISMLLSEAIELPRELYPVGGITSGGSFIYNSKYSPGEIDDIEMENRGYIEQQKLEKLSSLHRMPDRQSVAVASQFVGRNLVLVSDGLRDSFKLELALAFLKPIKYEKLLVASPIASVSAVDWMHLHCDEIYVLSVVEDFEDNDHYYDNKGVPDHQDILDMVEKVILQWQ